MCVILWLLYFFICFFKQKTAYEMRISDWSSDVCSSDLHRHLHRGAGIAQAAHQLGRLVGGDTAAYAQQDLAPPELVAGLGHVRKTLRLDGATAYPNGCCRPTARGRATRCNTSIAGDRKSVV